MIRLNEVIHPLQDVQSALIRRASVARHVVGLTRLTSSWFHHGASYHAAIVSLMECSFHPHFRLVALITCGMLVSCTIFGTLLFFVKRSIIFYALRGYVKEMWYHVLST